MFEQAFRNIDDALRKEAGCATEIIDRMDELRFRSQTEKHELAAETLRLTRLYEQKQVALAALNKSLLP